MTQAELANKTNKSLDTVKKIESGLRVTQWTVVAEFSHALGISADDLLGIETQIPNRTTRNQAEQAVRTLLSYFGENPSREGLVDTPRRFVDAYQEFLAGYADDPVSILSRTFEEVEGYQDIVLMRDIRFESHCEHHIQPMIGTAHVAYLPGARVVGISKLARVVDAFARRLQSQETLTNQIANAIETALQPRGVAVLLEAEHQCISTRGIHKTGVACVTRAVTGEFQTDTKAEERFMRLIGK
ncbi:MAG: GTP cyclohydrolase I FolE [Marinicaulis sp.]|nr:GTP cyclohydrolase I FolE [Marinicaulis sp.]NNL89260.1 GTP cyclohydrolase I FolE [Marinicaulis sp.]